MDSLSFLANSYTIIYPVRIFQNSIGKMLDIGIFYDLAVNYWLILQFLMYFRHYLHTWQVIMSFIPCSRLRIKLFGWNWVPKITQELICGVYPSNKIIIIIIIIIRTHWGPEPTELLFFSLLLVRRQRWTIIKPVYLWQMINTSSLRAFVGFLDRN